MLPDIRLKIASNSWNGTRRLAPALLTLVSLLTLCACGRTTQEAASGAGVALDVSRKAEWIDLDGLKQRLAAERGRVVVVNYWATWCEPCREEFPALIEFQRRYADRGVRLMAVSLDSPGARETAVVEFLAQQQPPFPVFIKTEGDPDTFINAIDPNWSGVLPATFIYDRTGEKRIVLFEPQTFSSLAAHVRPLL